MSAQKKIPSDNARETTLETEAPEAREVPFTVFNVFEKYVLILLASMVSIWSSIGSPIYYPALQVLETEFDISQELVNIGVVVYLVLQGISPAVCGGLADIYGRRPLLILGLIVFIGASVGIALTDNYTSLLILRCVQSAGISPAVAISSGVVGDVTQRRERGWFVGLQSGLTLIGQAFGSLIGAGLIAGFGTWRSIFWFLVIGGGVSLVSIALLLPETKRSIVGNGSVRPQIILNMVPLMLVPYYRKKWHLNEPEYSSVPATVKRDFLAPFKILIIPEVAICLLTNSLTYALWVVSLTCLTTQLATVYEYSIIDIGLCYLPAGVGGLIGSLISGKVVDFVYKKEYAKHEAKIAQGLIAQSTPFNIVRARVLVVIPFVLMANIFTIMYGWFLYEKIHIASVCVCVFFLCMGCISSLSVTMTLLIDLYPANGSAAASCVNLTRCLMAALFVAVLTLMNDAMTIGGTLTFMSVLCLCSMPLLLVPMKYGIKWSQARLAKLEQEGDKENKDIKRG